MFTPEQNEIVMIMFGIFTFTMVMFSLLYVHIEAHVKSLYEHIDQKTKTHPEVKYPYQEGETYFTLDKDGVVVKSCWDEVSEEMHHEGRRYFDTEHEAMEYKKEIYLNSLSN